MTQQTIPARFAEKIVVTESGCWAWQGEMNRNGYGRVRIKGRRMMVHRVLYERLVAPIREGLLLDHLCRNRNCCNPQHMEPVTPRENTLRGEAVLFKAKEGE